ncbi:conserved hypothetical protein [delta proteobacterium NaphS2]|nr:conserved hypothetical protein [delta proteobacterium NaphS2]
MENQRTTDDTGFDYMANKGREEKDRDMLGVILAVVLVICMTLFQYWLWY